MTSLEDFSLDVRVDKFKARRSLGGSDGSCKLQATKQALEAIHRASLDARTMKVLVLGRSHPGQAT